MTSKYIYIPISILSLIVAGLGIYVLQLKIDTPPTSTPAKLKVFEYQNTDLGFALTFPEQWKNVKALKSQIPFTEAVDFSLRHMTLGDSTVFTVGRFPLGDWQIGVQRNESGEEPWPWTKLGEQSGYIYASAHGQDDEGYAGFPNVEPNGTHQGPYYELENFILPTFKFLETEIKIQRIPSDHSTTIPMPGPTTTIYVNKEYGFAFSYPSSWQVKEYPGVSQTTHVLRKDQVFLVRFIDPANEMRRGCLSVPTLTADCAELLSIYEKRYGATSSMEISEDFDVFVRISQTNKSLKDWLIDTYRIKGSELQNYKPGESIVLGEEPGYYSSIGCCGNSDQSYVVKRGSYIYEFGSDSKGYPNNILRAGSGDFVFQKT